MQINHTVQGFDPEKNLQREELFALNNGFMAVRGYPEESTHAPSLVQSTFNLPSEQTIIGADWLFIRFSVNGQHLMLSEAEADYTAQIDEAHQIFQRTYTHTLGDGTKITAAFERALSRANPSCATQQITLLSDRDAMLSYNLGVDGNAATDPTAESPWTQAESRTEGNKAALTLHNHQDHVSLTYLFLVDVPSPTMALNVPRRTVFGVNDILRANEPYVICRRAVNLVDAKDWSWSLLTDESQFSDLPLHDKE